MKRLFIWAGILLFSCSAFSQDLASLYEAKQFEQDGHTLNYRILFPKDFDSSKPYPLVLFLHGAGERGDDNVSQLTHGGKLFAENRESGQFPAVVIFPQVPKDDYWAAVKVDRQKHPFKFNYVIDSAPTTSMALVMSLLDEITKKPFIDQKRVYVGGLSMGGMGTYEILARKPDLFAGAIAICGGADPATAQRYRKGLPLWAFHGEKDDVVAPSLSINMVNAINAAGGKARLTLYPQANHNSWDSAFSEPQLLPWLFSHQL